jgi:hypothetical protein
MQKLKLKLCSNLDFKYQGEFSVDSFILDVFNKSPQDPNTLNIDILNSDYNSILIEILIKSINHLFNIDDISFITIDHFNILQKYFKSFGFEILYKPVLQNNILISYDVAFIVVAP